MLETTSVPYGRETRRSRSMTSTNDYPGRSRQPDRGGPGSAAVRHGRPGASQIKAMRADRRGHENAERGARRRDSAVKPGRAVKCSVSASRAPGAGGIRRAENFLVNRRAMAAPAIRRRPDWHTAPDVRRSPTAMPEERSLHETPDADRRGPRT